MNSLRSKAINTAAKRIVAMYYILFLIGIACQREQPPVEPRHARAAAYIKDSTLARAKEIRDKEIYILNKLQNDKR